jgi:hypothetical protein
MSVNSRHRRCQSDDGAVLVELALVIPVLVLLVVGIMEYGAGWGDATTVERGLLAAGRVLSNEGNKRQADQEGLLALEAAVEPGQNTEIRKVIIYDATTSPAVPEACKSASTAGAPPYGISGVCNVYTGTQVADALTGSFSGVNCTGSWDARWCPTSRVREPNPDRVGIYAEVHYDPVTGLLPPEGITIARSSIYQLEPESAGS